MLRDSHLFVCHKFLEERGSQILTHLATFDFKNLQGFDIIHNQIESYVSILKNHALWEEEFIFKKFFTQEETFGLFTKHGDLEIQAERIISDLECLATRDLSSRVSKGKEIYLSFRIFYSSNLVHFHEEETTFLGLLQEKATDDEIRGIDKPIYESMSSADMIEMLRQLLPPANSYEKKNVLEDLKNFNPYNFDLALPKIRDFLTKEEAAEILGPIEVIY